MRWDRATAYLDEILVDLGKSVSRPLPEFNDEFEAVKQAMRDEYKKTMELNKKKWQSPGDRMGQLMAGRDFSKYSNSGRSNTDSKNPCRSQ